MKCVYDIETGKIWAWIRDDQDAALVLSNYKDSALAEIPTMRLNKLNCWKFKYDVENQRVIEIETQ
jgi:hypothetical protein